MSDVRDLIARVRESGATLTIQADGVVKARGITRELLDQLRLHKAEIVKLLKDNQSGEAATPGVPLSRLEVATAALAQLVPDELRRRQIRALAEAGAARWRFLGSAGYQHILADGIIDGTEKYARKLVCFNGSDVPEKFSGWFTKDIPPS